MIQYTPTVIIDGVEYIPAKQTLGNRESIARALLSYFYGECSDSTLQSLINDDTICILVNDEGKGNTLKEVLDEIAKRS